MSDHITARQVPGYCRGTCSDERSKAISKHISSCKACAERVDAYEDKYSPSKKCGNVETCLGRRTPLCYECKKGSEYVVDWCRIEEPVEKVPRQAKRQVLPYSMPSPFPIQIFPFRNPFAGPPSLPLPPFMEGFLTGQSTPEDEKNLAGFLEGILSSSEPCEDCDPTSPECQECARNPITSDEKKTSKKDKKTPKK